MSVFKKIRISPTAGVDAFVADGVVALRNVIGVVQGNDVTAGSTVFLNREEVMALQDWFSDLLENGDLWRPNG
jgi:hypothetical protein